MKVMIKRETPFRRSRNNAARAGEFSRRRTLHLLALRLNYSHTLRRFWEVSVELENAPTHASRRRPARAFSNFSMKFWRNNIDKIKPSLLVCGANRVYLGV